MLTALFYLIIIVVLALALFLFWRKRRQKKSNQKKKIVIPIANRQDAVKGKQIELGTDEFCEQSPYNPNVVVLQVKAFAGKPYMGYELHQALLAAGLRFGERNIFHYYANADSNKILFSLAAATSSGSFAIEDMGSFKCNGLVLFMDLDPKQKLMASFDLMLDTARQLAEELGGDICDDLQQDISADVIKRLREKICLVETSNLYVADLLDNLD